MRLRRWTGKPSIELTSWQTHQWERDVREWRSLPFSKREVALRPTRESFATLKRRV